MRPPYNDTTHYHVAHNIYAMKKQYGAPILVRTKAAATSNSQTGETSLTIATLRVRRAVVLQGVVTRDAKQSISLITAQKQMVQGGGFDVGKRTFIIDRRDVPRDFVLRKDDWIVFDSRHYDLDTVTEYPYGTAWVAIGKELVGRAEGMQLLFLSATDGLSLADAGTHA